MGDKLTVRQRQILGILNSQKERVSGREIAEYLGVTDRTIRTDIQVLIDYLQPLNVEIDAVRGRGYLLKSADVSLMQSLVYQADALLTPEDRIRTLTMILLESADPVQIDDLAEECYVSCSTIEHDLKVIAFEYEREQPHIRMIRKKNTVMLEADEWKRRYVMNLLYVRRWNFNYEAGILMADLPVSNAEIGLIEETLTRAQAECGIGLTEYDHVSFLFSIAIALRRIRMGFPVGTSSAGGTKASRQVVDEVLDECERKTGETFSTEERSVLSDELAHRQYGGQWQFEGGFWEKTGDNEYADLIGNVLLEMDAELHSDFAENDVLKSELLYILLTQAHNPYHAGLRDEYVTRRVRTENPDAVEMACLFEEVIRKKTGAGLTENYLFELVTCLAAAIVRLSEKKRGEGIPTAVISHMTMGATIALMSQIRSFFGSRVCLTGPLPVYQAAREGCGEAALAVATTKMKPYDESIPYLTISRMMDKKNFERMNFLVSMETYRQLYPGTTRWVTDLLPHMEVIDCGAEKSRGEILHFLKCRLMEEGIAGEKFCEAVTVREKQTSTAFREGFALPHAMNCAAGTSGILLMQLPCPADWGGIMVDQVFVLFLGKEQLREEMRIYCCLVYLLRRLKAQKLLDGIRDGGELRDLLAVTEKRG